MELPFEMYCQRSEGTECFVAVVTSLLRYYKSPATTAFVMKRYDRIRNPGSSAGGGGHLEISLGQFKLASSVRLATRDPMPTFDQIRQEIDRRRPVAIGLGQMGRSGHVSAHALAIVGHDEAERKLLVLDPWRTAPDNACWITLPSSWSQPIAEKLPSGYNAATISKLIATKHPSNPTVTVW